MDGARYVTPDDDFTGILREIDEGETIYLSRGYHTIDSPIRCDVDYVTITGEGINNTTIRQTGDFPVLELVGTQRRGDRRSNWKVTDVTFKSQKGNTTDLVRAQYGGQHHFERVRFECIDSLGNGVYAEECWDVRFNNCRFSNGGDPDEETADVYLYNGDYDMSNSIRFTNCTWDPVASHAIYSDSSGKGKINDRLYLVNCKFRGFGRGGRIKEDPEKYYVDGLWKWMKIINSHFNWSIKGFIRNQAGGQAVQVANCSFQQYGETALDLASDDNLVSGNIFESKRAASTAIRSRGRQTTIMGNRIADHGGIRISGDSTSVHGNTVTGPDRTGIALDADGCLVTGNRIISPGRHGILMTGESTVVSSNTCIEPATTGIRFEDARYCIATENLVRSAGERGIESVGDSDYLLVDSNVDVYSTATDVELAGTNNEVGIHLGN
ncbi:right-handed parallel beta-helix repeat-containing protein [Halomontanus rarus]|uniref:right-handed parallel beta-helix repeat-containing protein n=1 Tax=Halomontanus rarus TaxID=3034020 RepID=UPI0023E89942|nr:right-handed parallel beta-helix repeat-containing protein [Halovivax sp. TS33]